MRKLRNGDTIGCALNSRDGSFPIMCGNVAGSDDSDKNMWTNEGTKIYLGLVYVKKKKYPK